MSISAAVSAHLTDFGRTLDPAIGDDLEDLARSLKRDAALAVRSLVGLTLTVTPQDQPVTLTAIEEWVQPSDIRSSLQISFSLAAPAGECVVSFFAEKAGAFVDLADDLALELAAGNPVLDSNSVVLGIDKALTPSLVSGLTGVPELSIVNRAVGALMARGLTEVDALRYVAEKATPQTDRLHVAAEILANVARRS